MEKKNTQFLSKLSPEEIEKIINKILPTSNKRLHKIEFNNDKVYLIYKSKTFGIKKVSGLILNDFEILQNYITSEPNLNTLSKKFRYQLIKHLLYKDDLVEYIDCIYKFYQKDLQETQTDNDIEFKSTTTAKYRKACFKYLTIKKLKEQKQNNISTERTV